MRPLKRSTICRAMGLGLGMVVLIGGGSLTRAIDPGDRLRDGQDLIDQGTREIDRRVFTLRSSVGDRQALYAGLQDLLRWEENFARDVIAPRYRLDGPQGLLVRDGIDDTLATRSHDLLVDYITANPDELLSRTRQAFEVGISAIPMPPGRFLGFHFVHLAQLYAMQADTVVAVSKSRGITELGGVEDGFLRHVWDIAQVYEQAHRDSGQKHFCQITQENWIMQRIVCARCGHRGFTISKQDNGVRDDTTAACRSLLASIEADSVHTIARIACRHWGHIFDAECPQCKEIVHFSVPLPFYRTLMLEVSQGKAQPPDIRELIRDK